MRPIQPPRSLPDGIGFQGLQDPPGHGDGNFSVDGRGGIKVEVKQFVDSQQITQRLWGAESEDVMPDFRGQKRLVRAQRAARWQGLGTRLLANLGQLDPLGTFLRACRPSGVRFGAVFRRLAFSRRGGGPSSCRSPIERGIGGRVWAFSGRARRVQPIAVSPLCKYTIIWLTARTAAAIPYNGCTLERAAAGHLARHREVGAGQSGRYTAWTHASGHEGGRRPKIQTLRKQKRSSSWNCRAGSLGEVAAGSTEGRDGNINTCQGKREGQKKHGQRPGVQSFSPTELLLSLRRSRPTLPASSRLPMPTRRTEEKEEDALPVSSVLLGMQHLERVVARRGRSMLCWTQWN